MNSINFNQDNEMTIKGNKSLLLKTSYENVTEI